MEKIKKVLVAGAAGDVGIEIVSLLNEKGYDLRLLTRSQDHVEKLKKYSSDIWKVDARNKEGLKGIGKGIDCFISALGKSISLFKPEEDDFIETDFEANKNILDSIREDGIKRILYVSIKDADKAQEFEIPRSHKLFEEEIQATGIPYTIIRTVGLYSGLNDLAIMAKRKVIPLIGDGTAKTNSIHSKDLAEVIVSFIHEGPEIFKAGGPEIHTRLEMAEMLKDRIGAKIVKVPKSIAEMGIAIPELLNLDISDKLDFFKHVTTKDMIGEKCGKITYKEYLDKLDLNALP